MKNSIVLATRNLKKQKEMQQLVENIGRQVLTLREFPDCPEVIEDQDSFLGNSEKKAIEVSQFTGCLTIADDSGLEVDALNGDPGVYSARYANGEDSTDEENLQKVLQELIGVPNEKRTARFVCATALAQDGKVLFTTCQTVEGIITLEKHGDGGFGYDPIFYYPPYGKTLAQVDAEDKHAISHRGKAMRQVLEFLQNQPQ
jgi:XTP/dITP diphosphohydrolase